MARNISEICLEIAKTIKHSEASDNVCNKIDDLLFDIIMTNKVKPLSCDETEEIRTILKHIHEMIEEARETNACGNANELSKMVSRYLPCVETSYKNFIERSVYK